MKTNIHFVSYLVHFFLKWEMFQTKVVEKLKTHILCSVTFFFKSCRLWDNVESMVERESPQMAIWRMRIACWITKATNTHSEYAILIVFSNATVSARTHPNVTLYPLCLSCSVSQIQRMKTIKLKDSFSSEVSTPAV